MKFLTFLKYIWDDNIEGAMMWFYLLGAISTIPFFLFLGFSMKMTIPIFAKLRNICFFCSLPLFIHLIFIVFKKIYCYLKKTRRYLKKIWEKVDSDEKEKNARLRQAILMDYARLMSQDNPNIAVLATDVPNGNGRIYPSAGQQRRAIDGNNGKAQEAELEKKSEEKTSHTRYDILKRDKK